MKPISKKYINFATIFVLLSVIIFVVGITKRPFFIVSAILLSSYIVLDKKELRCRNCGGFTNLDRLNYAKKHVYHCSHCGEKIHVQ